MNLISSIIDFIFSLSFRKKLSFMFSFLVFFISLFIYLYFPIKIEKLAISSIEQRAKSIADMQAFSVAAPLFFNDSMNIKETFSGVKQNRDLEYIVIHNELNKPVESYGFDKALEANYTNFSNLNNITEDGNIFRISSKIYFNDIEIGKVYIGLSLENLRSSISQTHRTIATVSIVVFFIGLLFVIFISTYLTRPLKKIISVFRYIADGDLSQRAKVKSHDDIGNLAKSFNLMIERLESTHKNLIEEIEQRQKTQDELIATKEKISLALEHERELSELKSRFIAMVSHEYRSPLTVILTSTYLLDIFYRNKQKDEFDNQIKNIQNAIKNMTRLLDDVLTIGKSEAGKIQFRPIKINIIKPLTEIILQAEFLDKNKHKITLSHKEENYFIETDYDLFSNILTNILNNSIKFSSPDTEIIIEINDNKEKIEICVRDQGIGIPQDEIPMIFDPFYRARNVGAITGAGLGLTLVNRYKDIIKGQISITSLINNGTTFTLALPKTIPQTNKIDKE